MRASSSELPVTARELLAADTIDDIPVLLEVKAAVLARFWTNVFTKFRASMPRSNGWDVHAIEKKDHRKS